VPKSGEHLFLHRNPSVDIEANAALKVSRMASAVAGQSTAQQSPTLGTCPPPILARLINISRETCQAQFELGVALSLSLWPALTLAVQNQWGGPSSSDKRDWFGGAIVDLFLSRLDTDIEDVETMLLQVMLDEFEVNVDDESGFEVAEQIMRLRRDCGKGDFTKVSQLKERWEKKEKGGKQVEFKRVERGEEEDDTDWDSDDLEETDEEYEDEDVEMGDAPPTREKEKPVPEIDEDGFIKVTGKKKR